MLSANLCGIREKCKNLSVNPAGIVAAFYVEFYVIYAEQEQQ